MGKQAIAAIIVLCGFSMECAAQSVTIPRSVPYAADSEVAGTVKRECAIDVKLADFIAEYAAERMIPVTFAPETSSSMPGRVLVVEIRDATSSGNAFLGHHKSTLVRG